MRILKNVDGVTDVLEMRLVNKTGGNYSSEEHNIGSNLSAGGTILTVKENMILEIKYPHNDIIGSVV